MSRPSESQRQTDALFLLDALEHVQTPVIINALEIAVQQDLKFNTVQKRFNTIKTRYNLNLQTTSTGVDTQPTPSKAKANKVTKSRTQTTGKTGNGTRLNAKQLEVPDENVKAGAGLEDESNETATQAIWKALEGKEEVGDDADGREMNGIANGNVDQKTA